MPVWSIIMVLLNAWTPRCPARVRHPSPDCPLCLVDRTIFTPAARRWSCCPTTMEAIKLPADLRVDHPIRQLEVMLPDWDWLCPGVGGQGGIMSQRDRLEVPVAIAPVTEAKPLLCAWWQLVDSESTPFHCRCFR